MYPFRECDFGELAEIMERGCKCAIETYTGSHGLNITLTGEHCRLYLRTQKPGTLAVGNIGFEEKRHGTGTVVVNWLKKYAREKGFAMIVAIGVSHEAESFYAKNGFVKTRYADWVWTVPAGPTKGAILDAT